MKRLRKAGFTLVELLVVITIIGVLLALLLPAVQAAREAARRVQCKNHVKQLALAAIMHEEQHGHFPTSGWRDRWVGDADRGFGQDQPGGWAFNILPYLEESSLRDLAGDGKPGVITDEQLAGAGKLAASPIAIINCPSRGAASVYPHHDNSLSWPGPDRNVTLPTLVGKLDYAINAGDNLFPAGETPRTLQDAEIYPWEYDGVGNPFYHHPPPPTSSLTGEVGVNGVSFQRSHVGVRHVSDGTSFTYLIGEKAVHSDLYDSFGDGAWIVGYDRSICRFAGPIKVVRDYPHGAGNLSTSFGSAHASGFHMAYCDGSVRVVEYGIDIPVHMAAANRRDGTIHGIEGDYRGRF